MSCCGFGKMTMTVNGVIVSARGEFTLRPTNFETETGANADGTMWASKKPVPAEAEGSIDYCSTDINLIWGLCGVVVTFEMESGDTYVYPNAVISGRPELNTGNGEVSGFKVSAPRARRITTRRN